MISVAIDGPAGAGKSTISRKVSEMLGFIYIDTGALYRAIAYSLNAVGITPNDIDKVKEHLPNTEINIVFIDGEQHVTVNGEDVSGLIRTPEISMLASAFSAIPVVREFLLGLQRKMAEEYNVIMDGRDIGTVVLPNATVKIFLTADPEDRARRRYDELLEKGQKVDYNEVLEDIKKRDYNDSHREVAPLKPAENSIIVNTTGNTLEQSVELLSNIIKENIK